MTIKNVEKFRNDLYKNLEDVFMFRIQICLESYFERTEENEREVTHLYNPILIKLHNNDVLYITVDGDGVMFWKRNNEKKFFKYKGMITADYYRNQTSFQMQVAVDVQRAISKSYKDKEVNTCQ